MKIILFGKKITNKKSNILEFVLNENNKEDNNMNNNDNDDGYDGGVYFSDVY